MALVFYERVGHDGRRPSPYSWRIRYALAHKGVDFEVRPVRFADVDIIRGLTGQTLTPVLVDGDRAVHETWQIACHLEDRFPDRPSLFSGALGRGVTRHVNSWTDSQLASSLRYVVYTDFLSVLDAGDRAYFRSTREQALGMTLEEACADPDARLIEFQQACAPLELTLSEQPYVCGAEPAYADFTVFSVFQWARLGSPKDVVAEGSAIAEWRGRMITLFDNLADRFPGYN